MTFKPQSSQIKQCNWTHTVHISCEWFLSLFIWIKVNIVFRTNSWFVVIVAKAQTHSHHNNNDCDERNSIVKINENSNWIARHSTIDIWECIYLRLDFMGCANISAYMFRNCAHSFFICKISKMSTISNTLIHFDQRPRALRVRKVELLEWASNYFRENNDNDNRNYS